MKKTHRFFEAEEARSRSNLFRLLSLVYLNEITPELLNALTSKESLSAFENCGADLSGLLRDRERDGLLGELAEEYTALFIAPGGIPPYESVRLTGLLNQEPAGEVEEFYRSCGLQLREDRSVLPDHLGMELAFMGYLAEREGAARAERYEREASDWASLQRSFFEGHLGRWAFPFLQDLVRYAAHPFYREMAGLTRAFLETERDTLESVGALGDV